MKRIPIACLVLFFIFSCGKDITIQDSEALRIEALQSQEFKAMREAYKTYHDYKMNEVQRIINKAKNGHSDKTTYIAEREAYILKCVELMRHVAIKGSVFKEKYPTVHSEMNTTILMEKLRDN